MFDRKSVLGALMLMGAAACGEKQPEVATDTFVRTGDTLVPIADAPKLDSPTTKAPPETVYVAKTPAPRPRPPAASPRPSDPPPAPAPSRATVAATGTTIAGTTIDSVHSRYTKVGDPVRVRVSQDVLGANGKVAIPAGSVITLSVTEIAQADNRGEKGTLGLSARSVEIDGKSYDLTARATDYAYEMKARGVGAGEVAKTGAGAAAGAIIGRVIGGKTGTVVGAVGGAAAGAAVASKSANRDIVVHAGTAMTITLRDDFTRS